MPAPNDNTAESATDLAGAVRAYFRAVDELRFDDAVARCSDDVVFALPAPGAAEVAPRQRLVGRAAILARFAGRTEREVEHRIELCASSGSTCLFEGYLRRLATGERLATFCGSVAFDRAGRFRRYQAFLADLPATAGVRTGGDEASDTSGLATINRYLRLVDEGRFDEALDCVAPHIEYSSPAPPGVAGHRDRAAAQGRPALHTVLRARGPGPVRHELVTTAQIGRNWMVEGIAADTARGSLASFMASVGVDVHGLIDRYVGFYCDRPSEQ